MSSRERNGQVARILKSYNIYAFGRSHSLYFLFPWKFYHVNNCKYLKPYQNLFNSYFSFLTSTTVWHSFQVAAIPVPPAPDLNGVSDDPLRTRLDRGVIVPRAPLAANWRWGISVGFSRAPWYWKLEPQGEVGFRSHRFVHDSKTSNVAVPKLQPQIDRMDHISHDRCVNWSVSPNVCG